MYEVILPSADEQLELDIKPELMIQETLWIMYVTEIQIFLLL